MLHLVICGVGTVLATVGHFPMPPRLLIAHLVGLLAMVFVTADTQVATALIGGAGVAACGLLFVRRGRLSQRQRSETLVDIVAMSILLLLVALGVAASAPIDHAEDLHHHGGGQTGSSSSVAVAVAIVGFGWLAARVVIAAQAAKEVAATGSRIRGARLLALSGSALMLAGAGLMAT